MVVKLDIDYIAVSTMFLLLLTAASIAVPPVAPVESSAAATVGVNEFISFTITDLGAAGIGFGDFNPGTANNSAVPNPAVNLTVENETNIQVFARLKGTNFNTTSNVTLNANSAIYDDDSTLGQGGGETGNAQLNLQTTYPGGAWYNASNTALDQITQVFYFISIPVDQAAGDYSSTFFFQAARV